MRIYYPVNEFSSYGYSALPLAIFLSEKLVLWSPMPLLLDEEYEKGSSILNSSHILELVERGFIQVAGREEWFNRDYRNAMAYQKAKYTSFDTQLKRLIRELPGQNIADNPVMVMPKQKGEEWAKKVICSGREKDIEIIRTAKTILSDPESIPLGIQEKLARVPDSEKLEMLIRILRNNFSGMIETQCDNIVYWDKLFENSIKISGFNYIAKEKYELLHIHRFVEMCDYLHSLVDIKDYRTFSKNLDNRDTKIVRSEISRILGSSLSVGEEYLIWYESMVEALNSLKRKMIADIMLDTCLTVPGLFILIADIYLNGNNPFTANISFYNAMSNVANISTIIGCGKNSYDIIKYISKRDIDGAPVLPFIGGKLSNNHKKKSYREKILSTRRIIY